MKIVIAIDSFKGSLTSMEAGEAARDGIQRVYQEGEIVVRPLADGGEGTVEALIQGMHGERRKIEVTGPLGEKVWAQYGILPESKTAIMEMSQAAGLPMVAKERRNPLETTTYGVGEMIKDGIEQGCRRFLIGIGGSATNDGGIGMLQALGFELLDAEGKQVPYGAKGLKELVTVSDEHRLPELEICEFCIACDVENPLCGEQGCSAVFGPQKGATPEMVWQMDQWMETYAKLVSEKYPTADAKQPGTGAAGGLGFAFLTFLPAVLKSGVRCVLEEIHMEEEIQQADVVVTGEGRMDGQTAMGKAPIGVAQMAKKYGKPVIGLAGAVTPEAAACNQEGMDAFFPIVRSAVSLEEAMEPEQAKKNLADTAEQVFRLIRCMEQNTVR